MGAIIFGVGLQLARTLFKKTANKFNNDNKSNPKTTNNNNNDNKSNPKTNNNHNHKNSNYNSHKVYLGVLGLKGLGGFLVLGSGHPLAPGYVRSKPSKLVWCLGHAPVLNKADT